jgi:hypothetical protein
MADTDLQLSLRITADGKAAVTGLRRVDSALDDVGRSGRQAGDEAADGLREIDRAADAIDGEIAALGRSLLALASVEGVRRMAGALLEAGGGSPGAPDLRGGQC